MATPPCWARWLAERGLPASRALEGAPPLASLRGGWLLRRGAPEPAPADRAAFAAQGGAVVALDEPELAALGPALGALGFVLGEARAFPGAGPPIRWKAGAGALVFTDGSCERNGAPDAVGGFAAVFTGAAFSGAGGVSVVCGPVPAFFLGAGGAGAACPPTNVRAEWWAFAVALEGLRLAQVAGPTEVVTDHLACVKTLTEWLPRRLAAGTQAELANFDLIARAHAAYLAIRPPPRLTHVHSHRAAPGAGADLRARLLHRGNALADEHAAAGRRLAAPCVLPGSAPLLAKAAL